MNINELDSYRLDDAVKFHDRLNPRLWDDSEHLRSDVKAKLLEIAADFQQFLGVSDLDVKDITVSGSNAAYNYTPSSDIDLHLVVDLPEADKSEVYRELFDAKKYQYNNQHNIKIGGFDVELYVQNPNEEHHSQGIYSLKNNNWVSVPKRRKPEIDDISVKSKVEDLAARIDDAVQSDSYDSAAALMSKIKAMRKAGLEQEGEYGSDNLAFKILRSQGYIKKLVDARTAARDAELSLAEQNKVKPRVRYGFKEDVTVTPDGVSASTKMFLEDEGTKESIVHNFIAQVAEQLGITDMPVIELHDDPAWSEQEHSFGRYTPETHTLEVNLAGRHIMDILRTTAHELAHCRQNQDQTLPNEAGETGSKWENEAHSIAGIVMREYARQHPEMFDAAQVNEASGYIPTKKEKNDPRYKMALSVDVQPGATGLNANRMSLQTDAQGKPALLMKTANLRESLAAELEAFNETKSYGYNSTPLSQVPGEQEDELGNQEATGPEFPPQMPAGTTKVDVSDLTDWYRLGMDISDMDDADPEDYNQGPPQTVITFPSDEAEQGYLKQFKRLGLKTHDMDTDVEGGEDTTGKHLHKELAEEFALLEEEFLGEVKMTGKNLAQLASKIPGAMVGLEFEMIVPNVNDPDNDGDEDLEADYDQDERVRDIDDAVGFFDDGDYNSPRAIRGLREEMEENYREWKEQAIDQEWADNGFEFFQEYIDREEPFDPEDYQDRAEDEVKTEHPDLDPTSEEFEQLVSEKLNEINAQYYVETWEAQGRTYDNAYQEFYDEQSDNFSEGDWLDNQGIRYASDVENNYDVTWPYWTSSGGDGDDGESIKRVALDFMNAMGYNTIAVSSSYHGSYELWNGDRWVNIGSNKPMDAFAIEPDGSLIADDDDDFGLEFVSPPIPLDQIGETMKKVQQWAGLNGVYTGLKNKTSMHTNISIPGYNIDNLDYLKAALLLGDEHVLRDFERFGNTYAKPAIEKVRQLVKSNPDKAKELLDKMKSQLNAKASKLIHSGVTDKFTSINTKNNRIEFRSPGGDYLDTIANNPKKLQDTINRMVVAMDAAMDPNKYKEEYQKKLYKLLTGQQFGREGASGKKQEMKSSDKDLLNIFSRYAAGELPKQALKSFVRQAQLERSLSKGKAPAGEKYWWNVQWDNNRRMEVVAGSAEVAKQVAADEWDVPEEQLASATVTPLRPYEEPQAQSPAQSSGASLNGRPSNPDGNYVIVPYAGSNEVAYRFMASGDDDAQTVIRQWRETHPDRSPIQRWTVKFDPDQSMGQPGQQPAQTQTGNWGVWMTGPGRFARQSGTGDPGPASLRRFPSREATEEFLARLRDDNPRMRTDIEVREIPADYQMPNMSGTQEPQGVDTRVPYEIYNRTTGQVMEPFQAQNDDAALSHLDDYRRMGPHTPSSQEAERTFGVRRGPGVTNAQTNSNSLRPTGPGPWELASRTNNQVYFNPSSSSRVEAEAQARAWLMANDHNEEDFEVRTREGSGTSGFRNALSQTDIENRLGWGGQEADANYEVVDRRTQQPVFKFIANTEQEAARKYGQYLDVMMLPQETEDYGFREIVVPGSTLDLQRRRQQDSAQGGIIDVAGEQPATAPRTLTVPGQGQQVFTGQWKVLLPTGEEVYRFGGVGNSQSDANRVAAFWLRQNGYGVSGEGFEVLPIMGDA